MKTTALIEKAKDGTFAVFTPDIESTIIGSGDTVVAAKADFENTVKELFAYYAESGEALPGELQNISFEYKYDVPSVFNELDCINITQFAKLAGIYPSSMRQYARGISYISEKQARKIETALHKLGEKLQTVCL